MVELPVHLGFITRKNNILQKLTLPDSEYTDLSPKGSIDNGIRDLINDINKLHGLVTTSSCAGRVSVFVEGSKRTYTPRGPTGENEENFRGDSGFEEKGGNTGKKNTSDHPSIKESLGRIYTDPGHRQEPTRQFVAAGGKGAGYWLYVSHDPVSIEEGKISFHKQFGLTPGNGVPNIKESKRSTRTTRLVRFSFEPMVCSSVTFHIYRSIALLFYFVFLFLLSWVNVCYTDIFVCVQDVLFPVPNPKKISSSVGRTFDISNDHLDPPYHDGELETCSTSLVGGIECWLS